MGQYIVSARKYRPNTFGSVVGQEALTTTLKNAISQGKLAHAYLFCGPRGVGKTTCARIFAKTINCLTPTPEGDCCGKCESCRAFDEQRSYNIHELDAASNNSVDDIRVLCDQAQIPPQVGRYKVFIIDEVHMLTLSAFNAFLKTLEEPPAHAIFILATTEKHKVLPTILSRCQIYDFNRMEVANIVGHLRYVTETEGISYDEESLNVIAQKADGGMRDALSIFDQVASFSQGRITYDKVIQNLNVLDYEYYFRLTDLLIQKQIPEAMLLLNEVLSKGFAGNHFIGGFASHLRDLLVSRDVATLPLLQVAESVRPRYAEQAQRCQQQWLFRSLRLCNDCDLNYRASNNKRLLVELTLIEVAQADDTPSSGRRPTKHLNPIFETTQPQVAKSPTASAPTATPVSSTTPSVATTSPSAAAAMSSATTAPSAMTTPTPAVTQVGEPTQAYTSPSASTTTSSATGSSFRRKIIRIRPQENASDTAPKAEPVPQQVVVAERHSFSTEDLRREWLRFANSLPIQRRALSERMRGYLPEVTTCPATKVLVEGFQVKEDLEQILPGLLNHLRRELRNGEVSMVIEVVTSETRTRPIDKHELYQELLRKNPAMAILHEGLNLRFN